MREIRVIKKSDIPKPVAHPAQVHTLALLDEVEKISDREEAQVVYGHVMSVAHKLSRKHGFSLRNR